MRPLLATRAGERPLGAPLPLLLGLQAKTERLFYACADRTADMLPGPGPTDSLQCMSVGSTQHSKAEGEAVQSSRGTSQPLPLI